MRKVYSVTDMDGEIHGPLYLFRKDAENAMAQIVVGGRPDMGIYGHLVSGCTGPDEKDARIAALEQCIGNISDRIKNCRVAVDTNHDLDVVAMFDVIFEMTRDCCASIVYEERKKVHEQARAVQSEASSVVLHEE